MTTSPDMVLLQSLRDEIECLKRENHSMYERCRLLLLDVSRLEGALQRYGMHLLWCPSYSNEIGEICRCGLEAAINPK